MVLVDLDPRWGLVRLSIQSSVSGRPRLIELASWDHSSMVQLTDEYLLEVSGEEALEDVQDLILRSKELTQIDDLVARLPNLSTLSLSHNLLGNITCISSLQSLHHLNVSFNALTTIQVRAFPSLSLIPYQLKLSPSLIHTRIHVLHTSHISTHNTGLGRLYEPEAPVSIEQPHP